MEILGVQPEFWPFLSQILKPLGSVLQVNDTKITLPHLNARVLLAPNPGIAFPENISINFEGEPFIWKINKLGDIGACFHYKSNGHNKKECSFLKNISKEFHLLVMKRIILKMIIIRPMLVHLHLLVL